MVSGVQGGLVQGTRGEEGADPWQELPWRLGKAGSGFLVQQVSRFPSPGEWSRLPFFLPRQPPGQSRGITGSVSCGVCQEPSVRGPRTLFFRGLGLGSLRLRMTFVWAPWELWSRSPPPLGGQAPLAWRLSPSRPPANRWAGPRRRTPGQEGPHRGATHMPKLPGLR